MFKQLGGGKDTTYHPRVCCMLVILHLISLQTHCTGAHKSTECHGSNG